jgi:hypothetical protein
MQNDYSKLTQQFEAQDIDPASFRHSDHILVAYEMLNRYDFLSTSQKYSETIKAMATKAGVPEKFNLTITLAFLSLIAERIHNTPHSNFEEFLSQNEDLKAKNLLEKMYSTERLQSDLARKMFLLPACSDF